MRKRTRDTTPTSDDPCSLTPFAPSQENVKNVDQRFAHETTNEDSTFCLRRGVCVVLRHYSQTK